jgi:hypothetical protein
MSKTQQMGIFQLPASMIQPGTGVNGDSKKNGPLEGAKKL